MMLALMLSGNPDMVDEVEDVIIDHPSKSAVISSSSSNGAPLPSSPTVNPD
jgi:hypothetical protein